jgi:hypothetical protein
VLGLLFSEFKQCISKRHSQSKSIKFYTHLHTIHYWCLFGYLCNIWCQKWSISGFINPIYSKTQLVSEFAQCILKRHRQSKSGKFSTHLHTIHYWCLFGYIFNIWCQKWDVRSDLFKNSFCFLV